MVANLNTLIFAKANAPAAASNTIMQLAQIITDAVATVNESCMRRDVLMPDLDAAAGLDADAFRADPAVVAAANLATAAAAQLTALLQPPDFLLGQMLSGMHNATALRVCMETNVIEILREAGPQGLHVDDIAAKNGIDSAKLERFLRLLATHHVFTERSPCVFANNRISAQLDTGKSVQELINNPLDRHVGTPGLAAFYGHTLDEGYKGSSEALETLLDPVIGHSQEAHHSPLCRVFRTGEQDMWGWLEQPGQEYRLKRFSAAMVGTGRMFGGEGGMLTGFDWTALGAEDVVVDVGGGVGSASLCIAQAVPGLRFVVQDRPKVIGDAQKFWAKMYPEAISSGRVQLQPFDLFGPQSVQNPSVFLLRRILHDWSDKYANLILQRLRAAAGDRTKLVVVDCCMQHACREPSGSMDGEDKVPGAVLPEAPEPLLANFGSVNGRTYMLDIQERTSRQLAALLRGAGWKVVRVRTEESSTFLTHTEAVPI